MRTQVGQLIQLRPQIGAAEELSDEALAAACVTGDRAAQTLLFERHVDAVHRFISRMRSSDASSIDDLVQATFIAAFQSADRFKGPRLQSWLYGIATNVMRGYVRKEIARKRIASSLAEQPVARTAAPRDVDVARLRDAIATLSPKLREVIVLVDLEGASGTDCAAALGVPEGTVWRRLSDARAQLRARLGGQQ